VYFFVVRAVGHVSQSVAASEGACITRLLRRVMCHSDRRAAWKHWFCRGGYHLAWHRALSLADNPNTSHAIFFPSVHTRQKNAVLSLQQAIKIPSPRAETERTTVEFQLKSRQVIYFIDSDFNCVYFIRRVFGAVQ